jgi:NADH:ubiquinone oxidoreductase subunit E
MIAPDIDIILNKHVGARRDALLRILQEVQESCGYTSRDAIVRISERYAREGGEP